RLVSIKKNRDAEKVKRCLADLTHYAKTGKGNGLALAVEAMRARCTLGEVSAALESEWGRYKANAQTVSGVYGKELGESKEWSMLLNEIKAFEQKHGRRP